MSKKKKLLIIGAIIVGIFIVVIVVLIARRSYINQYNSKGVSSAMNIQIDGDQKKEKIGILDGYNIYIYHLDIDACYFTTIHDKRVYLKEAIKKELVSIKDWQQKALEKKKLKNQEIYYYENYEIVFEKNDCIIRLSE